jgi:hypothetical protein
MERWTTVTIQSRPSPCFVKDASRVECGMFKSPATAICMPAYTPQLHCWNGHEATFLSLSHPCYWDLYVHRLFRLVYGFHISLSVTSVCWVVLALLISRTVLCIGLADRFVAYCYPLWDRGCGFSPWRRSLCHHCKVAGFCCQLLPTLTALFSL